MATIPEVPPEQKIVPTSGPAKAVAIPTYEASTITPQDTFTAPFIAGESAGKLVGAVTDVLNKAADKTAIADAQTRGYQEQQDRIAQGDRDYIGGENPFTLSGKAYQAGANASYVLRKEREFKENILDLAEKRKDNMYGFQKEAEELKTKLFKDVPSNLTLDLSKIYDESRNNTELQIATRIRKNEVDANLSEHKDGAYKTVADIGAMIRMGGIDATGLPDAMVKLNTITQGLKENFGLSPKDLRTEVDKQRQELFGVWLKSEFERTKNTPAERTKIKQELQNGTYAFGALGEKYGNFIPGGKEVTLRENATYETIFKKYEEDFVHSLASEKFIFQKNEDQKTDDYSRGVGYNRSEDGTIKIPAGATNYDNVLATGYGVTRDEAVKNQFERAVALEVGMYSFDVTTKNWAKVDEVTDSLKKIEQDARALPEGYEKTRKLAVVEKATKQVDKIIKERQDARAKGPAYEEQYILDKLGPTFFPNGINPTTAETTREYLKVRGTYTNLPNEHYSLPVQHGVKELEALIGARSVAELDTAARDILNRQKEYTSMWLGSGLDGWRGADKSGLASYINYVELKRSGDDAAASQLGAAIFQRKENILSLKKLTGTDDSFSTEMKDATDAFKKQTKNLIDIRTTYGKSQYDSFEDIYLKVRAAGFVDKKEAMQTATDFVLKTNQKIKLENGNEILVPAHVVRNIGDTKFSGENRIKEQLNDAIKYPHNYNIIPATGQTYDDIIKDIKNYHYVYNNGHFVLLNRSGDAAATIFMKQPSGANEILISDGLFAPEGKNNSVVFIDKEHTWEVGKKSNFSSELPDTYTKNFPKSPGAFLGKTSGIQDRLLESYAIDMQKTFDKNPYVRNEKGKSTYTDWVVPHLVGLDPVKAKTMQAISLKAAEGNFNDIDALWLGRNVPYLNNLINSDTRATVIKEFNDTRKNMLATGTKVQSKNTGGTVMSPMQLITSIARKPIKFDVDLNEITSGM